MSVSTGRWLSSKSQAILRLLHFNSWLPRLPYLSLSHLHVGGSVDQFWWWHTWLQLTSHWPALRHRAGANCTETGKCLAKCPASQSAANDLIHGMISPNLLSKGNENFYLGGDLAFSLMWNWHLGQIACVALRFILFVDGEEVVLLCSFLEVFKVKSSSLITLSITSFSITS